MELQNMIRRAIEIGHRAGFVTFDQLNDVLPSESTSPEQIEDVMSMLSEFFVTFMLPRRVKRDPRIARGLYRGLWRGWRAWADRLPEDLADTVLGFFGPLAWGRIEDDDGTCRSRRARRSTRPHSLRTKHFPGRRLRPLHRPRLARRTAGREPSRFGVHVTKAVRK